VTTPGPAPRVAGDGDAPPRAGDLAGLPSALVHDWLTGQRGGENVLLEIARLLPRAPIYTLFHFPGSVDAELERHPIRTSFLRRAPGLRRHYRWYLPLFPTAIESFELPAVRLVVSTSHCVAKGIIPPPGSLHVCYCHTPMRYAWDQEHAYFPRRTGPVARLRAATLSRLRTWDVASAARVDRFVANSSFVAERIRRYYRREAVVVPPPVAVDFFAPGAGGSSAPGGYVLAVAALAPYKRLDLAIAACERAGVELRVVGGGPERDRLGSLAGARTRFLGRVPADELRALYRGARCLLQPGVEDFGIAAVEALACGTPVVALGEGGVRDIVVDGRHGLLVPRAPDADLVELLAEAIDKVGQIRFNPLDLRAQAETFAAVRFGNRLGSLLSIWLSDPEERGA
jgi:glycosyltransferase involved in cell wall biosynthesis